MIATWFTVGSLSLRTGRKAPSPHAGHRAPAPVLSSSRGACSLQHEPSLASPGCVSPAPGPDQVPIPGSPLLPGDEFPHYLRDLHIGHVPRGPECPGRVWRVTAGSSLSATYCQARGSQGRDPPSALAFVLSQEGPGEDKISRQWLPDPGNLARARGGQTPGRGQCTLLGRAADHRAAQGPAQVRRFSR